MVALRGNPASSEAHADVARELQDGPLPLFNGRVRAARGGLAGAEDNLLAGLKSNSELVVYVRGWSLLT